MIKLTEKEQLNENFKTKEAKKFCIYPNTDHWRNNDYKEIRQWMEI